MKELSHFDDRGNIKMVDVSGKESTKRRAIATGKVLMNAETMDIIKGGSNPKGNPFEIAKIAGIMAAKSTANLIPLCHQIPLSKVDVRLQMSEFGVAIEAEAVTSAQTGVEMEAMMAVSIAALTIYDMCKAVQKDMEITEIRLETKTGGKSGDFNR